MVCLLSYWPAQAKDKAIKLRAETIVTQPQKNPGQSGNTAAAALTPKTSGLFLIQFQDAVQPAVRQELALLGVDFLRYVPQDAFIVRFRNVSPDQLRALDSVQWVGEYRPDHKMHPKIRGAAAEKKDGDLWVSIVLSPFTTQNEKAQVRGWFRKIQQESHSRRGSVLRGHVSKGQIGKLAQSDSVLWIEPGPNMTLYDEVASDLVAGDGGPHVTYTQINGLDGSGVTVAVADSGLDTGDVDTMHPDLFGRVTDLFWYGDLEDASDGHSHGTHVAGIIAGNGAVGETDEYDMLYGLGVAPNANIVVQRLFDDVGNYMLTDPFAVMTRDAVRAGAEIGSNSWGDDTQGKYDTSAMDFDALVRDADEDAPGDQPYILEFSAGNAGPGVQTIGSPAVGKNVIATGASQNNRFDFFIYAEGQDAMADFSSRGPCEDGRIKPDIVAPGTWIASLASSYASDENAWASISGAYLYMGGTSQAGPHASGAAAVFVQYYRQNHGGATPSPALVKAALINSAVDMDDEVETGPAPNADEGWGRIDLTEIIGAERLYQYVDQTVKLTTGQTYEQRVLVNNGQNALKFTLAYTDEPAFPGAVVALVNDLDLEVIAPDGTVYHGNQFIDGESIRNANQYDSINNVEAVHLNLPLAGEYIVRVRARQVVEDALQETAGIIDQDFALVISGDLLNPGTSLVVLDRRAYTAPGRIGVKLYDTDLAGRSTVTNLVRSATEFNGESLILRAFGSSGVFTGSIATVTGLAALDGKLQVAHGDTIEAVYEDASPRVTRTAAAVCDLQPPTIMNVLALNRFGHTLVSWDTDEPADGIVLYGTDPQHLDRAVTNSSYRQSRMLTLPDVTRDVTHYFMVISADVAGNRTTNDNGGALFSFVPVPPATILVVDAFDLYNPEIPELSFVEAPISTYTDALDQIGVSYEVWDATAGPTPTLEEMRLYTLVIWRPPELSTFSAADQANITSYLNGGGSLLIASMEATSQLDLVGSTSFRQNVLHILDYDIDQPVYGIRGPNGDPITGNIDTGMDFSAYEMLFELVLVDNASDYLTLGPGASAIFYDYSGAILGLRYPQTGVEAPGRLVYLSFPLDAIPLTTENPARAQVLQSLLTFLVPGGSGKGSIALDRGAYTLPSIITIEVADSDLKEQGQLNVQILSNSDSDGRTVSLYETGRRGVFRGSINLVSATNSPASNQLRAAPGDTIRAEYYDASLAETKSATAQIDIIPTVISNVESSAGYVDAWITWSTTEASDSTVQFGKSKLLDRVAYNTALENDHALQLTGLDAEQTYYFAVISRDPAGNTTVDDNGGQLYTFQTLRPIHPPFTDDFTASTADWTVFTSEDSEGAGWQCGVPANGKETSAHSPPLAWGSNMDGAPVTYVESFLISPPILLTGGNRANLRFWHSYDFTSRSDFDLLEGGVVMIFTNEYSDPITLGEFAQDEFSDGWEETSFDLSPYSGQLVYLVWYYALLSFSWGDVYDRPGWLLDDVSVTVSNVIPGTIVITNNIWQAQFQLSGPLKVSGRGTSLRITNAPPGDYTLSYNTLPSYITPVSQSQSLAANGSVLFTGNYLFPDSNANGMSDTWEQQYFGTVSPTRTRQTDTDGDGASDYDEFVAGTDPRQPAAKLKMTSLRILSNGTMRMEWASVRDRAYRIEGSADAKTWTPVTDWMHTLSSTSFITVPFPAPGGAYLFRVVVQP